MSELVKELKDAAQQLVKVCNASPTKTLYARAADLLEKQDRLLGLYRKMCDYFARHEEEIDCIQMTKLLEKIKQEETL